MAEEEPKATLYDFAYVDRERTRSLTAQLFDGLNTQFQKVNREGSFNQTEGKLDAVVVSGGHSYRSSAEEEDTRVFDPHDILHLDLVSRLREAGYLKEDPESLFVGDIVLLTGELSLVNFDVVAPVIRAMAPTQFQAPQQQSKQARKIAPQAAKMRQQPDDEPTSQDIMNLMTELVPMTVQVYFRTQENLFWGLIDSHNSREPITNILLKYGPTYPGKWHMLALIDIVEDENFDLSFMPEMAASMGSYSENMRPIFGRPNNCIGVTPLLLFRKLAGNGAAE